MNSPRILGHNPAYRALWAARTVSVTGDAVATVALVFYASGRATPGPSVGLLLLAQSAPYLLGPFAGALADRVDQRRLLLACELGQAALFGAIALLLPPFPLLLALVLAATALAALALPAGRSAVPILAGPGEATAAYALLGSGSNLGRALGPALGGLLLAAVGPRGALALDVASFVAAAALLRGLPALLPAPRAHDAPADFLGAARVGWSYLLGQPTARAVAASLVLLVSFGALGNVALVFLARDALATGARGFGTLAAASAIGMVVGPLLALRPGTRPAPILVGGIALMGAGALLTGVAPRGAGTLRCRQRAGELGQRHPRPARRAAGAARARLRQHLQRGLRRLGRRLRGGRVAPDDPPAARPFPRLGPRPPARGTRRPRAAAARRRGAKRWGGALGSGGGGRPDGPGRGATARRAGRRRRCRRGSGPAWPLLRPAPPALTGDVGNAERPSASSRSGSPRAAEHWP